MTATLPNRDDVALRAYFIWDGEGRPHSRHEDHWFAAEALEARAAEPKAAVAASVEKTVKAKAVTRKKPIAAKKPAAAEAAAPKATVETVVAAAALAAPRAARGTAKGARRAL